MFFPNKWLNVSRWNICRIVHRELGLFMAVWIYSPDSALRSILLVMSFLQYVNTLLVIYPWPLTKFFFWNMHISEEICHVDCRYVATTLSFQLGILTGVPFNKHYLKFNICHLGQKHFMAFKIIQRLLKMWSFLPCMSYLHW